MSRELQATSFVNTHVLVPAGLTINMIVGGINYTHRILDTIDATLLQAGAFRLAKMVELANLSSMVGNLLGSGIANAAPAIFSRNKPHSYPDLLAKQPAAANIEIKVALETNKPKGHLAKPGYYLTCRYVLCDMDGWYTPGKSGRGDVVWIWEIRFGYLEQDHFSLSNTAGDSGKTAVVNSAGMGQLVVVYFDPARCPYSPKGRAFNSYTQLYPSDQD